MKNFLPSSSICYLEEESGATQNICPARVFRECSLQKTSLLQFLPSITVKALRHSDITTPSFIMMH